jgi:hypothetical protein
VWKLEPPSFHGLNVPAFTVTVASGMPEGSQTLSVVFICESRSRFALENGIPNWAFFIRTEFRMVAGCT